MTDEKIVGYYLDTTQMSESEAREAHRVARQELTAAIAAKDKKIVTDVNEYDNLRNNETALDTVVKDRYRMVKPEFPQCPQCGYHMTGISAYFGWIIQYRCESCRLRFLYVKYEDDVI